MGAGRWLGGVAVAVLLLFVGFEVGRRWQGGDDAGGAPIEPAATVTEGVDVDAIAEVPERRYAAPRVALVIDDLGRSLEDLSRLRRLGVVLTYAVLPFESRTADVVAELRSMDAEILCHLPMEALGDQDPGLGALTFAMTLDQLQERTRAALDAVPGAVGVNNHMGSRLSADRLRMNGVLEILADRRLYFLDSRTTAETVGFDVARELGIAAAERQVFLDRERSRIGIEHQFALLLDSAGENGSAIAIGHPYDETLAVLEQLVPRALREGFVFVRVSELLEGG